MTKEEGGLTKICKKYYSHIRLPLMFEIVKSNGSLSKHLGLVKFLCFERKHNFQISEQ